MDERIIERANQINDRAEEFVLSHAVMAMRSDIEDELQKIKKPILKKIKAELQSKNISDARAIEIRAALNKELSPDCRVHIIVDYCDCVTEDSARTIRGYGNFFEILLPRSLAQSREVEKLRKLVGHELGHLALDFASLLEIGHNTQGTKTIEDEGKERDCNKFAEEIIRLRKEHLQSII